MRKNLPVTQTERTYQDTDQLISATDLAGAISYCNPVFAEIAGFAQEELVGQSHNIVRHPDMPQAAFADLWQTCQDGKAWMGIVKNRCKNGDYYWVDAYVTPVYTNGKLSGYESVRVLPQPEDVERATRLYQKLKPPTNGGAASSSEVTEQLAHLQTRRVWHLEPVRAMTVVGVLFLGLAMACGLGLPRVWAIALTLALGAAAVGAIGWLLRPIMQLSKRLREVVDNPVMQSVYSPHKGIAGQIEVAIRLLQAGQRTILGRIGEHAGKLNGNAHATSQITAEAANSVEEQRAQIEQIATAMNEMAATVQEVARNTTATADATRTAEHESRAGAEQAGATTTVIRELAEQIRTSAEIMHQLHAESARIDRVSALIREVAEQTRLLALNAAIEAARAGEAGRGFSVVANEVSDLAQRTQEATSDIRELVDKLQGGIGKGSESMEASENLSLRGVESIERVATALDTIGRAVQSARDMSMQIATATEEQSQVADEINRNIVAIRDAAQHSAHATEQTHRGSGDMLALADELDSLMIRFGGKSAA